MSFRQGWPGKAESRFPCRSGAGHLYRIAHDPHRQCPSCISQISAICQKRGRSFTPLPLDSLYPGSLPASSHSPKISERLGSCPYSWEILSRPCPLDTSRTPYRTSGLPAGAELSSESKDIIASTNPKCPDTFEYNRTTQLHGYGATWLRKGKNRDHIAVQTVGAITPGAPALNSVRSTEIETSQFEQSSIKERQLEKA